MTIRGPRRDVTADVLFRGAVGCYAANCALGVATAISPRGVRHRWLHHALYAATSAMTTLSLTTALWARPATRYRRAAGVLAPAVIPLVAIAFAGSRGVRHPIIALSAAPFFVAAAHTLDAKE